MRYGVLSCVSQRSSLCVVVLFVYSGTFVYVLRLALSSGCLFFVVLGESSY